MDGNEDPGIWLPKELADKYTDDQLGKWFLNRYLIDYGNSFEYTVTRGEEKMMTFKRRIREVNSDTCMKFLKHFLNFQSPDSLIFRKLNSNYKKLVIGIISAYYK